MVGVEVNFHPEYHFETGFFFFRSVEKRPGKNGNNTILQYLLVPTGGGNIYVWWKGHMIGDTEPRDRF